MQGGWAETLLSAVLPPLADANLAEDAAVETAIPSGWPGRWVPNFSDWHRGDILLVAAGGSKAGLLVQAAQGTLRNASVRQAARFTHAAVYAGNGLLIEATPGRPIGRQTVWHYCRQRAMMLRRLPATAIAQAQIDAIADAASAHIGQPYSRTEAVLSRLVPGRETDPNRIFCSSFIDVVVAEATGLRLSALLEHRPLYPATLVTHPDLMTVPLEWRVMASGQQALQRQDTAPTV